VGQNLHFHGPGLRHGQENGRFLGDKRGLSQKQDPGDQSVFGFTSQKSKLEKKYHQLLNEAYQLSHVDRRKSDERTAEADLIRLQLEALEKNSTH
jgi:hypothetical protein